MQDPKTPIMEERLRLEDQVVSLELAKKLKALNVKQESFFYWCRMGDVASVAYMNREAWKDHDLGSAFTVAELGEMLGSLRYTVRADGKWLATDIGIIDWEEIEADTEADARAKMLINLIEQGLVEP